MKRIISIFVIFSFLSCLSGCQSANSDTVTFYYYRDPQQYQYFEDNSVICTENRDLLSHRFDLQYMAGLYLVGPMEESLIAPFTKNTHLLSISQNGSAVLVELSDHASVLTDAQFSLSSACFALTCMDFVPCEEVIITSGDRSITLNRENIVLLDSLPLQETNGG